MDSSPLLTPYHSLLNSPPLALQPQPHEPNARGIVGAGNIGALPFLPEFRSQLQFAAQDVGHRDRGDITIVDADIAHVNVARVSQSHRADKPTAKRVLDLQADLTRECTGYA